ncbi:CHAT domain-containing protein [Virgisporangium aurantiacum]|nr:CHAT domain-containing tetratricopeptide repeat protein [Virgisporangium aurantiacum]
MEADSDRLLRLALARPSEAIAAADAVLTGAPGAEAASIARQVRAIVLRDRGQIAAAIPELRDALALARRTGRVARVAEVQASLGVTLGLAGRTSAALDLLDEAATASSGLLTGRVLMRRGGMLREVGRYREALADLHRAIASMRRGGDLVWEARARSHRAQVYLALGQARRADRDITEAGRRLAAAGQEYEAAIATQNRAHIAFHVDDLPRALGLLDEAAARFAALSVPAPDLSATRSTMLLAAGLAHEALAVAEDAVQRHATAPALRRAELLFAAARAATEVGEVTLAVARATVARDLFRAQRRPWWQARTSFLLLQARYRGDERGPSLARRTARIAARLDALGAEEAPAAHLLAAELAGPAVRDRHLARAAEFRKQGPISGRPVGWLAHALRAEATGDGRRTLAACRQGLAATAEHLYTLGATELRAHAAARGAHLATIAQQHALRRGDARTLLIWSEQWRAVALAAPPARPPDDPHLAADLAALRHVMRELQLARAAGAGTAALQAERHRLEGSVRTRTRRTAGGPRRGAAGLTSVADLLDELDGHRMIELVAVDDVLYAVTLTGRRVRLHEVGPLAAAVREVELARSMLRRLAYERPYAAGLDGLAEAGERLERALLGPAAADTDEGPLVLIPPGRLHAVPWALIPSLRRTPVRVVPSAVVWLRARRAHPPRSRRTVVVIGPGLDSAASEAREIGRLVPGTVVLGDGLATADRTLAALNGAWTAHVAAHGTFRRENPLFSALHLDDGPLTVYDLARLRRAPFRLILSSCDSALAAHVGGDELLGMVGALVSLGTVSLLASVVPVNDAATSRLMLRIHRELGDGTSFASALLAARGGETDDPVAVATAMSFVALGC